MELIRYLNSSHLVLSTLDSYRTVSLLTLLAIVADGPVWSSLLDILVLLGTALVLGLLAERLKQSAIVGYLLAGTLVGPSGLGLVSGQQDIFDIAELGVSLLLFAIGLEFAPHRLITLGRASLVVGPVQIGLTLAVGCLVSLVVGSSFREALVIGTMVSLSSTACVLRLLGDRAELESPHGRTSLGVLLIQDVAVVPFMLIVTALAGTGSIGSVLLDLSISLLLTIALVAAFYILFNRIIPRLLRLDSWRYNRDLPILLTVVMALGAAWGSHRLGLSPSLGSFVAGVVLAMSPFATQIRADVQQFKTALVTLFFAAVGMLADVTWFLQHAHLVLAVVVVILVGKGVVAAVAARLAGQAWTIAVGVGLTLAQVGEFSFVLATIARGLLSEPVFRIMVTGTIFTLLVTPYLVASVPWAQAWVTQRQARRRRGKADPNLPVLAEEAGMDIAKLDVPLTLIVGFGPAGERVASELLEQGVRRIMVVDVNPANVDIAQQQYGLEALIGDATQFDILEHADLQLASAVVVTIPTPQIARQVILMVRQLAPAATIFARCRYHVHFLLLVYAGAHVVVDEEEEVGQRLAAKVMGARTTEIGENGAAMH